MATVYLMVGLPGSGKSKYIRQNLKNKNILSSDDIREEIFGELSQSNNEKVFKILHQRMNEFLNNGEDVVYDATNSSKKKRKHLISEIKRKGHNVVVIFLATPIPMVLDNNMTRYSRKKLPWDVLIDKIKTFDIPLFLEGMDDIIVVKHYHLPYGYNYYHNKTIGFKQNSAWHNETLNDHMITVVENLSNTDLKVVATWHDIGKVYCQELKSDGHTSYIGHERVSSYIFVSEAERYDKYTDKIATLIKYHMRIKNINTEKSKVKLINEVGEDNYNLLLEFNKADSFRKGGYKYVRNR